MAIFDDAAGDGTGPGGPRGGGSREEDGGDEVEKPPVPSFEESESERTCHLARRPLTSVEVWSGMVALDVGSLEGGLELRLGGPFQVEGEGERVDLDPGRPADLGPLLALLGAEAERLSLDDRGEVALRFLDGRCVRTVGRGFHRPWDVQGAGDLEAARPFFLPGG